jgi:tetratricopeptide (TPR) repeat protein
MTMHSISKTCLAILLLIFLPGTTAIAAPAHLDISSSSQLQEQQSDDKSAQLLQQGRELYATGQFAQAVKIWQQAAQHYQNRGDKLNLAITSSNLSLAYQQLGQWQLAKEAIAVSFDLLAQGSREHLAGSREEIPNPKSKIPNPAVFAQALNAQASLQLGLGQAETALSTWQQAATMYEKAGDRAGVVRSLMNQSQALQALGLYRRALETLNSVDRVLSSTPDSPLKATGLRQMGNVLRAIGDLPQSQQVLQRSLALAQQLNLQSDIAASLFSLGNTVRTQRNNQAALAYYQQAATTSVTPIAKLQARLNQFSLLVDEQNPTAQTFIPEIQSLLANIPPSSKTVYAKIDLAQSLMKLWAREEQGQQGEPERNLIQNPKSKIQNSPSP